MKGLRHDLLLSFNDSTSILFTYFNTILDGPISPTRKQHIIHELEELSRLLPELIEHIRSLPTHHIEGTNDDRM